VVLLRGTVIQVPTTEETISINRPTPIPMGPSVAITTLAGRAPGI
jgi:hypothetical protein